MPYVSLRLDDSPYATRKYATTAECLAYRREAIDAGDFAAACVAGHGAAIKIRDMVCLGRTLDDVRAALAHPIGGRRSASGCRELVLDWIRAAS